MVSGQDSEAVASGLGLQRSPIRTGVTSGVFYLSL
jgi:hypothetical protein